MANQFDMEETLTAIDGLKAAHETLQLSSPSNELKEIREAAFGKFLSGGGFPDRKAEEYKYSPFKSLVEQHVDFLGENHAGASEIQKSWDFEMYGYLFEYSFLFRLTAHTSSTHRVV